ncbi:MAG TPA: hypothetical protein DIT39_00825 [Tissierellales bacterium]|jgi:tetratricopeptide (TPR) repeat protein|uniref:tetratricopeptide repeat protein n=1 Tax=Gudongella oleilytica TaxID=1582259 RepID=UPI000ECC22BE|nr:hypothetical protein [Gudongella oleilytica]MDY0257503.1 hypothetical protein [Gudongella oleilytica]HCO18151.1 hypothetical protein [Tissierellales bacterium]HMM69217.1 hypothetical protein [Gudongella oleilytica]
MKESDKYFSIKSKDVGFVSLKGKSGERLALIGLDPDLPLPVITEKLIKDLSNSSEDKEISVDQIVEGISYTLGADENFPHKKDYVKILKYYSPDIDKLLLRKALEELDNGDLVTSGMYLRTLKQLIPSHDGDFYYAIVLERLAEEMLQSEDPSKGIKFLQESTLILEKILEEDSEYYPAYYKLGYHYRYHNQFAKAKLTWDKVLSLDPDEFRKEEIRLQLESVETDYRIEMALSYMDNMKYDLALDHLLKLLPAESKNWYVNYLIGLAYRGYGDVENAIEYLNISLELKDNVADTYNELGISYFNEGDIGTAIEIFTDGLVKCGEDYRLYFNRGLGRLNTGDFDSGLLDIRTAHKLNPKDEGVKAQLYSLENYMKEKGGSI